MIFISLAIEPSPSASLAALLESFSVNSVHFKILQQKAVSFGSSYWLNMWCRLHHYLVYHRDISHVGIPRAAGRVPCKHRQAGQDRPSSGTPEEEGETVTSREKCRGAHRCSRLLLIVCSSSQEAQSCCLSQVLPSPASPFWVQPTPTDPWGTSPTKLLYGRIFFLLGIRLVETDDKS